MAIPAAAAFVLDPGLLIDTKTGEVLSGLPRLLAELMGIYKILYFDFVYLKDDWKPEVNVNEFLKLSWVT